MYRIFNGVINFFKYCKALLIQKGVTIESSVESCPQTIPIVRYKTPKSHVFEILSVIFVSFATILTKISMNIIAEVHDKDIL